MIEFHRLVVSFRLLIDGEVLFQKDNNKELLIIPGANHTDLYDNPRYIPFDKIEKFLKDNLK
jgi:fermentation-respiration switch protein FrsA (DUF1100 family)